MEQESALNVDDCYHELGVAPGATDAEVKAAWRRMAARWHPDRNNSPHALHKIQRINQALEAIRRAKDGSATGGGDAHARHAEAPVEHTIHLTLEELASGCMRELRGEVPEDCADCEGSGLQPHVTACADCVGTGQLRRPIWFAWASQAVECGACHGRGTTRQGCAACDATGKAPSRKYRCRVQVPAGLRAGSVLDVAAGVEGSQRRHQLLLRVRVEIQAHEFFSLETDGTVTCEFPVDGFAWVANRWVEVPTPRGLQQMRLQRGTLSYRIRGAGLPSSHAERIADCIVTVLPVFPQEFSPQQETAIDRLVASNSGAANTPAGQRVTAWAAMVRGWKARTKM